jgi:hypothetical protein
MIYNGQNLMHVIPLSRVSFTFTNHCCLIWILTVESVQLVVWI